MIEINKIKKFIKAFYLNQFLVIDKNSFNKINYSNFKQEI
jgi:hypothetical protein